MVVLSRLLLATGTLWCSTSLAAPSSTNRLRPRQDPVAAAAATPPRAVNQTTCNGRDYAYRELAGYGVLPPNGRDRFGDTLGGLGSSVAIEEGSWKKHANGSYTGLLWSLPDRGWNTEGTLNYNPRVHKFSILFTPSSSSSSSTNATSPPNLHLTYLTSTLFTGPNGTACTGLDPDATGSLSFPSFPPLPVATYSGDGFGGEGQGGRRIPIDSEGLVLSRDGTFWVSDEYGPYIYHFAADGTMISAIAPPDAILPRRNGSVSFSAASPPRYESDREIDPEDPDTGRANNQGFEGLTVSGDGKTLFVLLQSAAMQEGGEDNETRRHARLLSYDVSDAHKPQLSGEWVVPLPLYPNRNGNTRVASQSEIFKLPADDQFFVLSRDSNAGTAAEDTISRYRQIDVFDISGATDVHGREDVDGADGSIASADGVLNGGIQPAEYCGFLDFNVNSQLGRFGLHNGGAQDDGLLNEKWEAIAVVPVEPKGYGGGGYPTTTGGGGEEEEEEVFVFSFSDNDFITQDGAMNGGRLPYADESGFDVNNQALVFRVTLPK